jgi:hypothetical protein
MIRLIAKKTNVFTTAKGTDIPVLEVVARSTRIPDAADLIALGHDKVPEDTYFIVELEDE